MEIKNVKMISERDWNNLVSTTYNRTYNFQQQNGCYDRGIFTINISAEEINDSDMNETVPEIVNGEEMGVQFKSWLARDPKTPLKNQQFDWELNLFWQRNFYPDIEVVANDLCRKGLIEPGEYSINID